MQLVPKLPAPLGDSVGQAAQSPLRSGARVLGYVNHKRHESLIKSNSGRGEEVTFSVSALAAYHVHGLVPSGGEQGTGHVCTAPLPPPPRPG